MTAHDVSIALGASCLYIAIYGLALVILMVPTAVLGIGIHKYQDAECDQPMVRWFWGLVVSHGVQLVFACWHQMTGHPHKEGEDNQGSGCAACLKCFILVWMIVGLVWYCGIEECDEGLKTFSLWYLLFLWLGGPIIACVIIVLTCCMGSMALSLSSSAGLSGEYKGVSRDCHGLEQGAMVSAPRVPILRRGTTKELLSVLTSPTAHRDAAKKLADERSRNEADQSLIGKRIEEVHSQLGTQTSVEKAMSDLLDKQAEHFENQSNMLSLHVQKVEQQSKQIQEQTARDVAEMSKALSETQSNLNHSVSDLTKQIRRQNVCQAARMFAMLNQKASDRELELHRRCIFAAWSALVVRRPTALSPDEEAGQSGATETPGESFAPTDAQTNVVESEATAALASTSVVVEFPPRTVGSDAF